MPTELGYYTTSEVARQAGLGPQAVRAWVKKGWICPAMSTAGGHYRFDPAEVARVLSPGPTSASASPSSDRSSALAGSPEGVA
ncbi:MerR family transcriptional regulator [Actinomyces wuliandei]|uniref:MerR family transcriptional regulator n=1 Tax=Actinomyces wuliandei TaxID=2057743 RepID=UPI000FD9A24E|nr:MerR family transcriptional regulator [Actinomyces wuliandei]